MGWWSNILELGEEILVFVDKRLSNLHLGKKLRNTKKYIREWVKSKYLLFKMEENIKDMEDKEVTHRMLMEEQKNFTEYQSYLRKDKETWTLEARILWL